MFSLHVNILGVAFESEAMTDLPTARMAASGIATVLDMPVEIQDANGRVIEQVSSTPLEGELPPKPTTGPLSDVGDN